MDSITFSEIMGFYPEHNHSVYEELKKACQHDSIIPFIGAGLSVFCGYKDWPSVLKELAKFVYDSSIQTNIKMMIERGELLQAAQEIQNNYPRILKELQKMIDYGKIKNCDHATLYSSAAYVLPYLFNSSFVMTTNFDRVLEEVYDRHHAKFGQVITPYDTDLLTQSRQNNPHCLFKLHGDIGPEIHDIERLIFTQTQYDKAYADNGPLMQELPHWFQSKKLLFLGCSLAMDKTMEVLQQVTVNNPGLDHYAILACPSDNVSQRCVEMGNCGISAIYYPSGKHEAVRVILERLLEEINYSAYEELCHHTKKTVSTPNASSRFMYDSHYIAFVGREQELIQLQEFCQDSEQISWWAVAGPGGIGKSRLVYEFTNSQKADGWEICWLKHNDYDNLSHWTPPVDRCIVVADDVQAYLQAIGDWIISISSRQRSEKLRIIILERDGRGLTSAKWAEQMQAESPYDDTIFSKCYCSNFLNLAPLSDDELKAIMMDFAKASSKPLARSEHADRLLGALKKIDSTLQRPIYALAITDAWCSGKDPTHWSKEQVLDALVMRELKFYHDRLRSLSTDKISKETRSELENLLAKSCTVPFLPLAQIADDGYPKLHKRADKLDLTFHELLRQTGIVNKIEVYIHIQNDESENLVTQKGIIEAVMLDCPDLIKEYVVLRQVLNKNRLDLLLPEGWGNNPIQLLFIERILIDYSEKLEGKNQFWTALFESNPKSELSAQIYGRLLLWITAHLTKMEKHALARLEGLYYHFHDSEIIAHFYAMGLFNLSIDQKFEERIHSVDKLRLLYELFPASTNIAREYAKGLINLAAGQTLEDCVHSVDKLRLLYELFPASEEFTLLYAMGLGNLSIKQTLENRTHSVNTLRLLYEQFPASTDIAREYAMRLSDLAARQTLEERTHSVNKLRLLYEQFPTSTDIAREYAMGLGDLAVKQTLEERTHSVDKLRLLYELFPTNTEIAVIYAKGLVNLTIDHTLKGHSHSIDKLRLSFERFPASEEFTVSHAMGLGNLAIKQTSEDCVRSVDKLRLLYEQFPTSTDIASSYAKGLVNLVTAQTSKDYTRSVDKLKLLYKQFPTSTDITSSYADGLVNLAKCQTPKDYAHSVDKLRLLYEQFPANEEFAVSYASGLVNLFIMQPKESDVQENMRQVEKLLSEYSQNAEIQLLYARTLFDLTLTQKHEALYQTTVRLREFLLEHPKANLRFQDFLDDYLNEHPDHAERYTPLRV